MPAALGPLDIVGFIKRMGEVRECRDGNLTLVRIVL